MYRITADPSMDSILLQNMGIRDEFHQNSILACIEELKSGRPIYENDYALLSYTKCVSSSAPSAPASVAPASAIGSKQIHEMAQFSFSQLRKCDQCHKYLRGIIHQGMLCKNCGIVTHRTCARLGIQNKQCSTSIEAGEQGVGRSSPRSHFTFFGTSLCAMFDVRERDAPEILQLCCAEIERQAKTTDVDLYRLYQSNLTSNEMVSLLRSKLNVDLRSVNFGDYSLQCIVAVMKKFLRDLPDPVIPVQFYDYFIQASSKYIHSLIFTLPNCNVHFSELQNTEAI